MCEELFYQIINTSSVNRAVFRFYYKFAKIITKKNIVLAVASDAELHFFEFI